MLDIAQDLFVATAYRTALIVALEEFFGSRFSTPIWRSPNTVRKNGPSERAGQVVAEKVRNRGLN